MGLGDLSNCEMFWIICLNFSTLFVVLTAVHSPIRKSVQSHPRLLTDDLIMDSQSGFNGLTRQSSCPRFESTI